MATWLDLLPSANLSRDQAAALLAPGDDIGSLLSSGALQIGRTGPAGTIDAESLLRLVVKRQVELRQLRVALKRFHEVLEGKLP